MPRGARRGRRRRRAQRSRQAFWQSPRADSHMRAHPSSENFRPPTVCAQMAFAHAATHCASHLSIAAAVARVLPSHAETSKATSIIGLPIPRQRNTHLLRAEAGNKPGSTRYDVKDVLTAVERLTPELEEHRRRAEELGRPSGLGRGQRVLISHVRTRWPRRVLLSAETPTHLTPFKAHRRRSARGTSGPPPPERLTWALRRMPPRDRRLDPCPGERGLVGRETQMREDASDRGGLGDDREHAQSAAAPGAAEHVHVERPSHERRPVDVRVMASRAPSCSRCH